MCTSQGARTYYQTTCLVYNRWSNSGPKHHRQTRSQQWYQFSCCLKTSISFDPTFVFIFSPRHICHIQESISNIEVFLLGIFSIRTFHTHSSPNPVAFYLLPQSGWLFLWHLPMPSGDDYTKTQESYVQPRMGHATGLMYVKRTPSPSVCDR